MRHRENKLLIYEPLKKERNKEMIELKLYQNNNQTSEFYKKWYARADPHG